MHGDRLIFCPLACTLQDVKMFSDTVVGIPSQCFVAGKAGVGANNFPKGRHRKQQGTIWSHSTDIITTH